MSKIKILCIDGGGIRGIIPGQLLAEIEKHLQIKIWEHFDMIAGTSTGGIIGCALLCPQTDDEGKATRNAKAKYSAEEVVNIYLERGSEIFNRPMRHRVKTIFGLLEEKYPATGLENALQDYFQEVWLDELLKPCLITSYDITRSATHFFTQHDARQSGHNYAVKDIARATSAAPTYFECAQIKSDSGVQYPLIDGGVFANNPAMCAYAEVRVKKNISSKDMKIFSLGTGSFTKNYTYAKARKWGMAQWVRPVIDIMMSGVAETVDYQLKRIFETSDINNYLRINGELTAGINPDMDCVTEQNLMALKQFGTELFQKNRTEIEKWFK